jgi:hypothetical protein
MLGGRPYELCSLSPLNPEENGGGESGEVFRDRNVFMVWRFSGNAGLTLWYIYL